MKKISVLIFFIFISCGEPEVIRETEPAQDSVYESQAPINFGGDINTKQGLEFSFDGTTLFSEDVSSGHVFTIQNKPSWLTLNATTGEMTGEPEVNQLEENIVLVATNIGDSSVKTTDPFSIAVNGDPLREYAWHLKNTGQRNFASSGGASGIDVNVYGVFQKNITGQGIRIAVSDSGVETNHDDLYLNGLNGEHKNYTTAAPYFDTPTPSSAHGTAVTGIIAASGWNNRGSIGIAPNAKFAGFQFLNSPQTSSILFDQASGDFDVYNYSYGETLYRDTTSDADYIDLLKDGFLNDNKLYVKSSGNEFLQIQGTGANRTCVSHNANIPFEHESPYMLVVGAVDAEGKKAFYSNAGSNLWVVGTGGLDGSSEPAIMTTDLPTCFKGYSKSSGGHANSFEFGHAENSQCHYTSTMNGTSAGAPSVTGVIALIKEANSSLSARDIKHILASTSKQVDASFTNDYEENHPSQVITNCENLALSGHTYEQGWVTNSAGYKFSNFYGFGLVDADAAVTMAQGYSSSLGTLVETNPNFNLGAFVEDPAVSIPDNSATGVSDTMAVAVDLTIEAIQLKVEVTHSASGQIGVELTSPDGTKSILLNINNSLLLDSDSNLNVVLLSNAFYGESSQGTWTLKVVDGKSGNTGTLDHWHLNIIGH